MIRFLLRRLLQSLLVIWTVSLLVFVGVYCIGDPSNLLVPPQADQATVARVRAELGLDLPLHAQYGKFLLNALKGDLGVSFVFHEPAVAVILERLPATLELAFAAMFLAITIGLPLGLLTGQNPDGRMDRVITTLATLGFSLPTFWVGMLLISFFSIRLGWLPTSGRGETVSIGNIGLSILTPDGLRHLILPALNLALFPMAFIVRLTRSGLREAMGLDFVKFARAQGNSTWQVIVHYVLRYISIPIVTLVGLYFGILVAFAVVTESVFAWPGVGKLIIDSINVLDRPIIVAYVMMTVVLISTINLMVDLAYALLDPRIRLD